MQEKLINNENISISEQQLNVLIIEAKFILCNIDIYGMRRDTNKLIKSLEALSSQAIVKRSEVEGCETDCGRCIHHKMEAGEDAMYNVCVLNKEQRDANCQSFKDINTTGLIHECP